MNRAARLVVMLTAVAAPVGGQTVATSPHNLSISGPGPIRATGESEICLFCHTPHNSSPRKPLWNRRDPAFNYTPYGSTTADAAVGQPTGAAMLCLSCHDGTIALGDVLSRAATIDMNGVTVLPPGTSRLGTNLSDDHPVSFTYDAALAGADGELADPATLVGPVRLEGDQLQCTACHDPHDNSLGDFLVATTAQSQLCGYCHTTDQWATSSHATSTATWNGVGTDPWFHTPHTTVADNACENCHNPHNAGGPPRLLNQLTEEDNCLDCHNGNVAAADIRGDLLKPYAHDVFGSAGVHDPTEPETVQQRHVECPDCHNPHTARNAPAVPPDAGGRIAGSRGVDGNGNPVAAIRFEYELCYRCHADSPDKPGSPTARQIVQANVRLEFDPANPSFHPVEGPGQNPDVPSLLPPYTESSVIYCSDCHAGDGGGAAGPHGSIYPQILKFSYETADNTPESFQAYRLCYTCHDRTTIIDGTGNFARRVHRQHIVGEDTPCNVCHDPHGISIGQGNSTNNSHLVNFQVGVVQPNSAGRLEFIDTGTFSGECYLSCHGENHNPEFYNGN